MKGNVEPLNCADRLAVLVEDINPVRRYLLNGRNEDMMLVGDIECVQTVKPKFPAHVWLYEFNDRCNDSVCGSQSKLLMSVDGTLKRLPAQPSPHFSSQAICNLRYVS